jgi:EmrB/QacA subfamily drug resistance transporter
MSANIMELEDKQDRHRWWVLAIVVAAQFMFVVDAFVVNVAIPSIRTDLHATTGEIQSVIAIYQIAFAGLIITGGRLGDLYGPKPAFLIGVVGFTGASLWCGLCTSGVELVAARAVQGVAAAIMVPQVLAVIQLLFPGEERGKAFGIFGFTMGLGAAVGFALGGFLVSLDLDGVGWRSIFFVNLPIGAFLLLESIRSMPCLPGKRGLKIDVTGATLLFAALVCIVAPLSFGADFHWSAPVFAVMAGGLLLLILLWPLESAIEKRKHCLPIVHLDLFRDADFVTGLVAIFFFTFANLSFYLLLTLYLQLGLGLPALKSGLTVLPLAISFAIVSRFAAPRAQKRGVKALIEGCVLQIGGLFIVGALIAVVPAIPIDAIAMMLVIFGAGQAMVMAPLYGLVLSKVPAGHAGSGGGVLSTVQQVGNSCGIVTAGSIFYPVQSMYSARLALCASLIVLAMALSVTIGALTLLGKRLSRRGKSATSMLLGDGRRRAPDLPHRLL